MKTSVAVATKKRMTKKTSVAAMKPSAVAMKKLAMKKPRKSSKNWRVGERSCGRQSSNWRVGERPRRARMLREEKQQLEAQVSELRFKVDSLQQQLERHALAELETLAEKNFEVITLKGDLEEVLRERNVGREEISKLKRQNRDLEVAMAQSNYCLLGTAGTPEEIQSRVYAAGYRSSFNFSVKFGNDMESHCKGWLAGRRSAEVSKTRVKEEPMTD